MSEESVSAIKALVKELDEQEALGVYWELAEQFAWAGSVFTRADAEQSWKNNHYDPTTATVGTELPMPDEVWDAVASTWQWNQVAETMCERGWDTVDQAVMQALEDLA